MEKNELLESEVEVVICDEKRKEEVKKELGYCRSVLKREYGKLYTYQLGYFCLLNTSKDVVNSMKLKSLCDTHLDEIMRFCDARNSFLITKLKTIHSYTAYIENILTNFDKINDFDDIESIDTKIRLMLISLGTNLPSDIFGEPF